MAEIFAVVSVACPAMKPLESCDATTLALPSDVLPTKKVTVPVGATPTLSVSTNATSGKFVLAVTLVGAVIIVVAVAACVTVRGTLVELLAL